MRKFKLYSIALLCIAITSCRKDILPESETYIPPANVSVARDACGTPTQAVMLNMGGGTLQVSNDDENVFISVISGDPAFRIKQLKLAYGTIEHLTTDIWYGNTSDIGMHNPDLAVNLSPAQATHTIQLPISSLTNCFNLNVFALMTDGVNPANDYGIWIYPNNIINSYSWSSYIEYCLQNCPPPPIDCGQLRTQTPGGWGAKPAGNNPGMYLHTNFSTVFSTGFTLGCYPNNYYISFTDPQAITDLLPVGGPAKALTQNYINPSNPATMKNVLVGHLTALTLSVGFDSWDPDFGAAGMNLGNMVIGSGTFTGLSVYDFLYIANNVLGGCNTSYTAQEVLSTATAINENYVDGGMDNGFLNCPNQ